MGILASLYEPKVYGDNCTRAEWEHSLAQMISGSLQDEEDYGEEFAIISAEVRRSFPQITLREFIIACARFAKAIEQ